MAMDSMNYLAKSKIPSRHANSVQVANMVCAFAGHVKKINVHLPGNCLKKINFFSRNIFLRYGLSVPENAKIYYSKDSSSKKFTFENAALNKIQKSEITLSFTRSPYIAWKLAELGHPVIFESHWFSKDAAEIPIQKFVSHVSKSRDSGIIATSQTITDGYLEAGINESRIITLPNSVNVKVFSNSPGGGLRRIFGSRVSSKPAFVYTGSLQQGKGARFLAQAALGLLDYAHIVIVGGNQEEIERLRRDTGNPSNLFLHPSVPHKDIPAILQDATGLIMPYSNEGTLTKYMCPLKMFEYLASGKPVVSADLPAISTTLEHGKNALLFESRSIPSLQEQIRAVMDMDPKKAREIRSRQLDTVSEFSWENRARTILDWHQKLRVAH